MIGVRKFFQAFDMFVAPATLRAREEPETSSGFGGFVSFIFVGGFFYVLISNIITTVNYNDISSTQTETVPISLTPDSPQRRRNNRR